jgi:hypothetical protein
MTVPYNYEGRARQRCPTCEVEIDVVRPSRPIGKDSTRSARKAYATEPRRQIVWEATCPDCRSVIDIAEYGPEQILGAHQPAVSRVSGQLR